MDAGNTTADGWGSGNISCTHKSPTYAGSYDTPSAAFDVVVVGDYAYVADNASGLQVINITDPTNPTYAGSYDTPSAAYGVAIAGDYAYVADNASGLQVINITDPTNPIYAGSYDTPSAAYDVAIAGDFAYVADSASGLQIINITDPTNLTYAGSYDTPSAAYDIDVAGDTAYIADNASGLQVIDISDPTNPTYKRSYDTSSTTYGIAVMSIYTYLADNTNGLQVLYTQYGYINPVSAGSKDTPGNASDVAVEGDCAYIADGESGLQVINITDPTNPIYAGSYDTPGYACSVVVAGDYAYVTDTSSGLQIVNIRDSITPTYVSYSGFDHELDRFHGFDIDGDYCFLAHGQNGLLVYDFSDPTIPTEVGYCESAYEYYYDVAVAGVFTYVAAGSRGLQVVNIITPENPVLSDYFTTPLARSVDVAGDFAYVADASGSLQVINITDPNSLTYTGSCSTSGSPHDVFVEGNYAYVADYDYGLQIINISNPVTPTVVSSCDTPGTAWNVFIEGNYAYVADDDYGFQVINITDPKDPVSVGAYNPPNSYFRFGDIFIEGDYAYVASNGGLVVFDITDPTTPILVGSDGTGGGQNIVVSGDYAYITNEDLGLWTYEKSRYKYRQFNSPNIAQSSRVFTSPVSTFLSNITLTSTASIPENTYIHYYLSADGGENWEQVTPGAEHTFSNLGTQLKWKVELNASITVTPRLYDLTLDFIYIINPPKLSLPNEGKFTTDNTPTFSWESVPNSSNYRFQLDIKSSFDSSNLLDIEQPSTTYTPDTALADGTWYWRVAVKDDENDQGPFSMYRSLIIDTLAPTIDHPEDITYLEGDTGEITWNPSDTHPSSYSITRDGTEIDSNSWSGNSISISESLPHGTHTYICTVYDQAGLSTSDTVIVTVNTSPSSEHSSSDVSESSNQTSTSTGNIFFESIVFAAVMIGVLYTLKRRLNK